MFEMGLATGLIKQRDGHMSGRDMLHIYVYLTTMPRGLSITPNYNNQS